MKSVVGFLAKEFARGAFAGKREELRLVFRNVLAQRLGVEILTLEHRVRAGHVLGQIRQAQAMVKQVAKVGRCKSMGRQSGGVQGRPELVARSSVIRADLC